MVEEPRYIENFVERLVEAGWSREDAEAEWKRIQEEEDESGYDGP